MPLVPPIIIIVAGVALFVLGCDWCWAGGGSRGYTTGFLVKFRLDCWLPDRMYGEGLGARRDEDVAEL